MPKQYPFEFLVDEDFYRSNQHKQTVMIIVNDSKTYIVQLEGYTKLKDGLYRLHCSDPPPGEEQHYASVLRVQTKK